LQASVLWLWFLSSGHSYHQATRGTSIGTVSNLQIKELKSN